MPQPPGTRTIEDLIAIMAALRTPGSGCPWDLQQSFESIAPYTIEEAYEVAGAIESGDRSELRDELGDLLLQVVYHARMAEEEGSFAFADVVRAISEKMIRRHPHVFGGETLKSANELTGLWERIKAEEKAAKGKAPDTESALDGVPASMPALSRAIRLQDKAARVGFDWPDQVPVRAKVHEELRELEFELDTDGPQAELKRQEEFGDLLFALVNLGRHLDIDPETALRSANAKFMRRFARIEALLEADGRRALECDLDELEGLWERAKFEETPLG